MILSKRFLFIWDSDESMIPLKFYIRFCVGVNPYFWWRVVYQLSLNCELPDVQTGFRKGRGTRDQIANICSIIEKAREFQKNIYCCFIDYAKAFDCVGHNKLENYERDGNTRPPDVPLEKPVCRSGSNS